MKKKCLAAGVCLACALIVTWWNLQSTHDSEELMMMNIEALATGESDTKVECYGWGSLDCPITENKVSHIYYE